MRYNVSDTATFDVSDGLFSDIQFNLWCAASAKCWWFHIGKLRFAFLVCVDDAKMKNQPRSHGFKWENLHNTQKCSDCEYRVRIENVENLVAVRSVLAIRSDELTFRVIYHYLNRLWPEKWAVDLCWCCVFFFIFSRIRLSRKWLFSDWYFSAIEDIYNIRSFAFIQVMLVLIRILTRIFNILW